MLRLFFFRVMHSRVVNIYGLLRHMPMDFLEI
jgi:hypothetical protein